MPKYKITVQLYRTFTVDAGTPEEVKAFAIKAMKESGETVFNVNEPKNLDAAQQKYADHVRRMKEKKKE